MTEKKQQIKYHSITKSWGNNQKCREFAQRIDAWLSQFTEDEKPLMLDLLRHYTYYSENSINKKAVELYEKFTQEGVESYVFAQIQKEFGVGFSDFFYSIFWIKNNVKEKSEKNIFDFVNYAETLPETIVVLDDYSGSGRSFIKFHKHIIDLNPKCKELQIYFLTIQISSVAVECINKYAIENEYRIKCISLVVQNRAFLDNVVYKSEDSVIQREKYKTICERFGINQDYIFGFKHIEALVSFEYNTPNNTLGIFWKEMQDFCWLFDRYHEQKSNLRTMQREASKRKEIRNSKTVIQNVEETKFNIFLSYCMAKGKSFSVGKICEDLGYTIAQANKFLEKSVGKGYIELTLGYPSPTDKLKNLVFNSRIAEFKKLYKEEDGEEEINGRNDDTYIPKTFSIHKK